MPHDRHEAKTVPELAREGSAKVPRSCALPTLQRAKPHIFPAELSKVHADTPMAFVEFPRIWGFVALPPRSAVETYLGHSKVSTENSLVLLSIISGPRDMVLEKCAASDWLGC